MGTKKTPPRATGTEPSTDPQASPSGADSPDYVHQLSDAGLAKAIATNAEDLERLPLGPARDAEKQYGDALKLERERRDSE